MISIQLPSTVAGVGYAGACRPDKTKSLSSRCRVDLIKWREHLVEWKQMLQKELSMMNNNHGEIPRDPFLALKHAEIKAISIAEAFASRRMRKPDEIRSSFNFGGHRALFRELNLLWKAHSLVNQVFLSSADVMTCPSLFHSVDHGSFASPSAH